MFLIGTNSVHSTLASTIIKQIENFIVLLRHQYQHLTDKHHTIIAITFLCSKASYLFLSSALPHDNICSYNENLLDLSSCIKYDIVNFQVMNHH
ncbi:unnamed protein product [Rotaria sordida]|uniref:Uncharacterized protein n=1 Tax=Rotaria sordida TaxID=392033 RepID=A0A820HJN7_9BILA|nr:unnamed protein product [Rotaria sordida]CAF4295723.1 unnamed protein product [Rotaria sordida]